MSEPFEIPYDSDEESIFDSPILQRVGILIVAASLLLGLIGNTLFYENSFGVNIIIFTNAFMLLALSLLGSTGRTLVWKHLGFGGLSLVFSVFLAFYTNSDLIIANLFLTLITAFIAIRFATIPEFLGGSWRYSILAFFQVTIAGWIEAPLVVLPLASKYLGNWQPRDSERWQAVGRGLLIAAPVILVFGLLLGSADLVFAQTLYVVIGWFIPDNISALFEQIIIIGFISWFGLIAYRSMLFGPSRGAIDSLQQQPAIIDPEAEPTRPLGIIEAGMVLGSVVALFAIFCLIQFQYLFGGENNISSQGYTYSEYARRGFFEIVAVSILTMTLIIALNSKTRRNTPQEENTFVTLSGIMISLTGVLLIAAFRRLDIYIDEFGFTRLRVETQVFIVWLGILFTVLLADLIRKQNFLRPAIIVCGIGFILTLNVMNLDGFIASRNISRFEDNGKIDIDYLVNDLSYDAIPAVATLLDSDDLDEYDSEYLRQSLGFELWKLRRNADERSGLGYHVSYSRARSALEEYSDKLDGYIQSSRSGDLYYNNPDAPQATPSYSR